MSKRVCLEPGCPALIDTGSRCTEHTRARDRARGSSTARGYGYDHQQERKARLPDAYGKPCCLCGKPMLEGQRLALDHTPDRTGYRGMAHEACNARDGQARRGTG